VARERFPQTRSSLPKAKTNTSKRCCAGNYPHGIHVKRYQIVLEGGTGMLRLDEHKSGNWVHVQEIKDNSAHIESDLKELEELSHCMSESMYNHVNRVIKSIRERISHE